MNKYLSNRWFKVGFWIFILGGAPLWSIVLLAAIGLWPDPNPNPVGPGLLFFLTAWPGLICMAIGAGQVLSRRD